MGKPRDTYKYHLKVGKKIVHRGITDDLNRREQEHRQEFPGSHIVRAGRRTTREAALSWERKKLNKVKIEPKELRKLSASTRSKLLKHKDNILRTLDKRG